MGIFMGAQSMRYNSTARDDGTDSQLDSGSPCYGDSKEGLHLENCFDVHASFLL